MSTANTIQLRNLVVLTRREDGNSSIPTKPVEIKKPSPCAQKNAKGTLRSYSNLKEWRSAAWETGTRFRLGFATANHE